MMYRIMYRFKHMRRSESAVIWSDEENDLVEARFASREEAMPLLNSMKEAGGDELASARIERIR